MTQSFILSLQHVFRKREGTHPLFDELHRELVQQFRAYLIVGGMPASVATWVETHDYLQCADEQDDIHQTYYGDFVKYAAQVDPQLLRNTLRSVIVQVGCKLLFYRTQNGTEVDFVLDGPTRKIAVECKYKHFERPVSIAALNILQPRRASTASLLPISMRISVMQEPSSFQVSLLTG